MNKPDGSTTLGVLVLLGAAVMIGAGVGLAIENRAIGLIITGAMWVGLVLEERKRKP